jgi:hypothetical protein
MPTTKYPFERYLNVRGPSFSPDGKRLSFLTDITGVAGVWSIPIDIHASAPAWPDQLTFRGELVAVASYSPTDDVLPDPLGHRGCLTTRRGKSHPFRGDWDESAVPCLGQGPGGLLYVLNRCARIRVKRWVVLVGGLLHPERR